MKCSTLLSPRDSKKNLGRCFFEIERFAWEKMRSKKQQVGGEWEVTIIRSNEEIEDIRPIWEEMQKSEPHPVINADIDRYLSVVQASDGQMQPYIIFIKQRCKPVAMVIARIGKHPVELKLGYTSLLSPKLRCLIITYGGILGQLTNDVCALLFGKLMKMLRRREVDIVFFNHLRTDSHVYQLSRKLPGILSRGYFPKIEPHWRLVIPESMDHFLRTCSKNRRKHLMRYIRKIEQKYPGRVKIVTYTREDELEEAMKAAAQISSETYQRGLYGGFVDDTKTRTLLTIAARKNWLRFDILYIDDKACAFRRALRYRHTCFGEQIGYSPERKEYNIGTILFLRVLESLCEDPAIDYFDFGFGGGEHKRWGNNQPWYEASVYIFAPRPYPIFVNMVRTFTIGLNRGLEYIFNKTGLAGWIKRRWRDLLQVRSAEKASRVRR